MLSRIRRERPLGHKPEAAAPPILMSEVDMEAFYREIFLPLVRRATWKYRLSKDDARDIVQDAFVLAIPRLDSARNPKAWLIQAVDHLALNHQRKIARRAKLAERWIGPSRRERPVDEEEVGH